MNWMAEFVVARARVAWLLLALIVVAAGLSTGEIVRVFSERSRLSMLQTEAERRGIAIMSQTLNGNMMGSLAVLGLIGEEVKADAQPGGEPNGARMVELLESLGRSYDAEGMFIVGTDGVVKSSWDNSGKPSTGLNVKFRPYYQMGIQGTQNVYAAVSLARGDRSLYFAAPVYSGRDSSSAVAGVAVARTGLHKIDDLLRMSDASDLSLLLSPQGVSFASSRKDWIGRLAGAPTPERLRAIREIKQFGNMFEQGDPALLPLAIDSDLQNFEGIRYAVARARVQWNDPFGDWTVVLMENLARSVPVADRIAAMLASSLLVLLFGALFLQMLRGRHAQTETARQMQAHARMQETLAQRKTNVAAASLQLQQADTPDNLAQTFLRQVHGMLGIQQGAIYVVDADSAGRLKLTAGYGCAADVPRELAPGEGLLGQCALERKALEVDVPQQGYWRIVSGLGETMPRQVLLLPILRNEVALGVVELAMPAGLGIEDRAVLDELLPLLALNLEVALRNRKADEAAAASAAAERELARMGEVERFNRLAQGREQRIVEVKRLANELAGKAGAAIPFPSLTAEPQERAFGDPAAAPVEKKALSLAELVDLGALQTLFSNFCEAVGVAAAIIDLEGKVLASARWQRACTDFHRAIPGSCARCIESDTELALKLQEGKDFTMYKCKNGMTDCASPIVVEGQHLANVFIGQFHIGPPDPAFFTEQAKAFGYAEADYLQAVGEAPVMDEKRLPVILGFLTGFAHMIATMSLARHRADAAQQHLQRERIAAMSLAEDAAQARRALESTRTGETS
ncbi:MAG: PocR ligand-binding domain-containing protein [Proteobacteria bacterium]|nr:PocR ligand-binding domain-containing protein [Pseudomonadota bacterium]